MDKNSKNTKHTAASKKSTTTIPTILKSVVKECGKTTCKCQSCKKSTTDLTGIVYQPTKDDIL